MKKTLISFVTAISIAFSADMGEDIFNNNALGDGNYINDNVALTPKQKALMEAVKRKEQKAREEIISAEEEVKLLQENLQFQNSFNETTSTAPSANQNSEYSQEELNLMKAQVRNQDLKALQQTFFDKNYSGFENTKEIDFQSKKTQKIITRMAMATTLIFDSDIESIVLGDTTGFKIEEIPNKSNAIAIKPLLIGIDTSLTIFTRDKKIHSFYVYSTDYKNKKDPEFLVYVKDETNESLKALSIKEKKENYIILNEDEVDEIAIKKSDISTNYIQKVKKENQWLLAEEIFSDKKFTYFKYSKDKLPQIPTIFAVIDGQDSPVETRILGDYIIAETINPKFTIKSGQSYVCVENLNNIKRKINTRIDGVELINNEVSTNPNPIKEEPNSRISKETSLNEPNSKELSFTNEQSSKNKTNSRISNRNLYNELYGNK